MFMARSSPLELRNIFITVGTTEFDELVQAIDSSQFVEAIAALGCRNLSLQIGRGNYEPKIMNDICVRLNINFSCFRFKPTLDDDMRSADLIVSHCGAGSILECISLRKLFIVVVNETLQENHQSELADELAAGAHCFSTLPNDLVQLIGHCLTVESKKLKHFETGDPQVFADIVDSCFEWSD